MRHDARATSIRLVSLLVLTCIAVYTCVVQRAFGDEARKLPNVVLIVADDLGYGELGCYGQTKIKTPHLDALATEGMRFTQFYSGSPVCAPSRCVLMTGKHSGHAEIRNNRKPSPRPKLHERHGWEFPGQEPLSDEQLTLAELLKEREYVTGAIGKWGLGHVGTSGDPNRQGIDFFYGYHCQVHAHNHYPRFLRRNAKKEMLPGNSRSLTGDTHSQDRFTEEAIEFIQANQDDSFFLFLPFIIPHLGIQVPDESLAQYSGRFPEEPYKHGSGYVRHPEPRAGYAAMISHMDRAIGRIVDKIDSLGLSENTLILFTSDNGPTYRRLGGADSDFFESAGPLRGRKGSVYEGGIRVPLIARWKGRIEPGKVSDHIAAFWDFLPTICEATGARLPDDTDGISFLPTLLGDTDQAEHEFLYWEFPAYGFQQAVRAGDWKIVRHGVNQPGSQFELYHLGEDVGESENVAAKYPEVVRRLAGIADREHVPSSRFPLLPHEIEAANSER